MHAADGGKDIASRAAELCGGALADARPERVIFRLKRFPQRIFIFSRYILLKNQDAVHLRIMFPDLQGQHIIVVPNGITIRVERPVLFLLADRPAQQYRLRPLKTVQRFSVNAARQAAIHRTPYNLAFRINNGELSDSFEGRQVTPGHDIEAMWFIMDLGKRLNRPDLIEKAKNVTLTMINYGWDKEYGGIYYFMDRKGCPPQQLEWDQKLWWVHIETLISLLKGYQLTGDKQCMEWFEKIHEYVWTHFKDAQYPEWFGYLNRQGEVLLPLKGGKWKGCFHVPRGLYQCWKVLEELQ